MTNPPPLDGDRHHLRPLRPRFSRVHWPPGKASWLQAMLGPSGGSCDARRNSRPPAEQSQHPRSASPWRSKWPLWFESDPTRKNRVFSILF